MSNLMRIRQIIWEQRPHKSINGNSITLILEYLQMDKANLQNRRESVAEEVPISKLCWVCTDQVKTYNRKCFFLDFASFIFLPNRAYRKGN